MLYSIFKDGLVYTFSGVISRAVSFVLIPVYMRVLTPADYGSLDLLLIFASLVNLTIAFEVSQGLARLYTSETDLSTRTAYLSTAFWFTVFNYSIFSLLVGFFAEKICTIVVKREGMTSVFVLYIIYIWVNGIFSILHNQFRWDMKSRSYAITSVLITIVSAFFSISFSYYMSLGLFGVVLGMLFGVLSGFVYVLNLNIQLIGLKFDFYRLKQMLCFSLPLVASGIAVYVNSYIDRIMISQYLSVDEVGVYGVGFRLSSAIGLIAMCFNNAITPYVYKHYCDKEMPKKISFIFRIFVAFALIAMFATNIIARDFLYVVNISSYDDAAEVLDFLIPAVLISQMYVFAPGLDIEKKTFYVFIINFVGAFINVVLNYFTIPVFGLQGAAFSTLIGSCSVFVLYMFYSQKYYPVPHDWRRIAVAILLVIVLHLAANFFNIYEFSNILLQIVFLLLCILVMFVARLFVYDDILKIIKIINSFSANVVSK